MKKCLFSLDAYVFSCPTCTKTFEYNIFIFLCNITISRWNIIFSDKCICKKWKHVEITIKLRWGMGKRRYKNWLQKFSWTIKFSSNSTMMGCRLEWAQWNLSSSEFKFDDTRLSQLNWDSQQGRDRATSRCNNFF